MKPKNKKRIFSRWQIYLVLSPGLILFGVFIIYPAIANIIYSFTDYRPLYEPTQWVGLKNYIDLFTRSRDIELLGLSFKNTIIIAILVSVIQNVLALTFAVLLNRKMKLRNLYRGIIFLPMTLGVVIQGLVWKLMLNPNNGTFAKMLSSIGIKSTYFGDPNLALYLVIMIIIWSNIGFAMTVYLSGLQSIPDELYDAGLVDGATGWKAFKNITLPLIRPALTVNVLICLIGSINILDIIIVTTNGGPGFSTYNLPYLVLNNITIGQKTQGFAAAVSVIQFLFTFIVVFIVQIFLRKKEVEL
jgi:ABC-type sugar transport system permease subunit